MVYTLTLSVGEDSERLYRAIQAEDLQTPRAKVTITHEKNATTFSLTATDFAAFRAMESAIMRLLTIHAKMKALTQ
jgi:tRNA threonylcarbamoyladenosine modification (KEOPS) complex  Pcc1 subunit